MTKKISSVFICALLCLNVYSYESLKTVDLSKEKPSWKAVIGGEAVAPVAETTYGFGAVSDGRMVSTCTYSGNVMWQKGVKGKPSRFFSSWGDFLYTVSNKSTLNFINPSGVTVWSEDTGFEVTQPPVTGWDGRIFVQGDKNISCYGIKGTRKWTLKIPHIGSLPLRELTDGSFLIFLSKAEDGKTTALRISPFGEVIEEITFAGQILNTAQCPYGVLMTFTDGSSGLCSVENETAVSKWVYKNSYRIPVDVIIAGNKETALLINTSSKTIIEIISNSAGELLNSFDIPYLNSKDIKYFRPTSRGFFACDSNTAVEFDSSGTVFFEAFLPQKNKWNYVKYTDKNQILICMKDWVLNSFLMSQTTEKSESKVAKEKFYTKASSLNKKIDGITWTSTSFSRLEEIRDTLKKGNYGLQEKQILSELQEMTLSYIEELSSRTRSSHEKISFYEDNPVYTQTLLEALTYVQTDTFSPLLAQILILENDPILLNTLILSAGKSGYDKNGELLKAFETIISKKIRAKDKKAAFLLCDSVYNIVAFMGRPALYRQGKQILSNFMYPQYDKDVKDYARKTLTKIISLEL